MKQLFKKRLSSHILHMTKYLKYVFNDFFVIALIFLVGGLGLAYSNFLKTLRSGVWWISLVIGLVMLVTVQLGRLATLTQDPDYVFLLPTDGPMKSYLKQAAKYSYFNASIIQIVAWFILLPLLKIQFNLGWPGLISWLLLMLALKFNWLTSELNLEFQNASWVNNRWLNQLIWPVIMIILGMFVNGWLAVCLAVGWGTVLIYRYHQNNSPVNWLRMIRHEDHRMHDIYTIFNMFVDVPNFGSAVVRRHYLAPLLKMISLKRVNTYLYLYWHGFVRDKEFSNLYLRLTLIGIILMLFMNGNAFPMVMGLVFIYLIIFQIVPFYYHFDSNAFIHIYPLKGLNQLKSFQKMLWTLATLVEVLFLVGFLINSHSFMNGLLILVLMTVEAYTMINVYLPRQVKKHQWEDK